MRVFTIDDSLLLRQHVMRDDCKECGSMWEIMANALYACDREEISTDDYKKIRQSTFVGAWKCYTKSKN